MFVWCTPIVIAWAPYALQGAAWSGSGWPVVLDGLTVTLNPDELVALLVYQ